MDLNGHIGPEEEGVKLPEQDWVGPYGNTQKMTYNVRKILELCKRHHLIPINTAVQAGSGRTFFAADGSKHRNEFILVPQAWKNNVTKLTVQKDKGKDLQLSQDNMNNIDHVPMDMHIEYQHYYEESEQREAWDYEMIRFALHDTAYRRRFLEELDEWLKPDEVQRQLENVKQGEYPDAWWRLLNRGAREMGRSYFGSQREFKKPWMTPEVKEQREKKNQKRKEMRKGRRYPWIATEKEKMQHLFTGWKQQRFELRPLLREYGAAKRKGRRHHPTSFRNNCAKDLL